MKVCRNIVYEPSHETTRSNTGQPVQSQKMTRSLKVWKVEELYYPSSENDGADQLRSEADLRVRFRIGKIRISHDAAHIYLALSSE